MTQFNVDVNASSDVVAEFTKTEQSVLQTLETLQNNAERSLASWTGQAQEQYNEAKTQWTAGANAMQANFGSAITALNRMISTYTDGDQAVARVFTRS